jgi:hypothetical protein
MLPQGAATQTLLAARGYHLSTLFAGNGPDDGLKGYTSTTVNVRLGAVIYTYNAEGRQLSSTLAR